MDFQLRKSPNRIFLHISNPADEKMIQRFLADGYKFVEKDIKSSIDLFILSSSKFNEYRSKLSEQKKRLSPEYLPVIVLVKEHRFKRFLDKWSGDVYDDILPIPISPVVLKSRVQSLLKQRQHSLELIEKTYLSDRAINATDIGITITDNSQEDNPLIFVNDGFEALSGYNRAEILGRNCRFLQNEDTDQKGVQELREAIDSKSQANVLLRNYKKDGSLFWNDISVFPIKNSNDQHQYFVGIQNDVTELINTQNKLKELVNEKEVLLQEIHHRIKNNLAVIVALLELKIMDSDNGEAISLLRKTRTRIFSISKVHELLYQQSSFNEIQFHEYVEGLVKHLNNTFSRTSENLEFELDLVQFPVSLSQAVPCGMLLSELIANAIKHGFDYSEKGKIQISILEKNGRMVASVKDNGKGLPENKDLEETEKFTQSILYVLLKQLDAEWDYRSEDGFEFRFNFELRSYSGVASNQEIDK